MYVDNSCIGCGICVDTCPVNAILIIENKASIDSSLCLECGLCADICPIGAIHEKA
ncbi:MAG TPA: 4Fe-4S binding protein [Syntrophomonas sp.]|nr:4Fe-4S binding protein [Syntrophomonas sp.]